MVAALELCGLGHSYGDLRAIRGLDLEVGSGEVVCLLGPSGCGKSTTLRLAAGLEQVQEGVIRIDGKPVADKTGQIPPEGRDIGLVFQDYALFPHLSVLDNILFGLMDRPRPERMARATEMLERVRMEGFSGHYPHMLSGGEQQRVALARTLAPGPRVMLLDEPYSGLDARLRDQVRDEVLHLLKEAGCATLMVTHNSEEAMFMADRIVVMRDGEVMQSGTPAELYCNPASAFVAGFFNEINSLSGVVKAGQVAVAGHTLPAEDHPDGTMVDIAIRPEAFSIGPVKGVPSDRLARVVEARLLGRTSLIHLSYPWTPVEGVPDLHLHARAPGVVLPEPGQLVSISIDLSQVFIFPAPETPAPAPAARGVRRLALRAPGNWCI